LALAERYAVERVLGQGGSAIVCLAQDLRHSRPVAIKVLRPEIAMFIGKDRFLDEIETVAKLQHPLILPLYDSGEADGLLYFVMPHVQGDSLRDRLEREKQLPVEDALAIARDVATALAFAHERGVVHRDIKPENIMLFGGSAVVADFGIARVLHAAGDPRKTDAGLALGTPLYMSPEQTAASGDMDARSDQYSLACVLYEMLGGAPPFTGVSPADVLAHHISARPRLISELRSTVPPALTLAVAKALSKLPADRFRTVTEFADAILAAPGGRTRAERKDHRRVWAGASALFVVVLALLFLRSYGPRPDPRYYFVPPFSHRDALVPRLLSADNCALYLRESLKHWRGLTVVDGLHTADILGREEPVPTGVESAARQARMLGAGRLILGTVWMEDTTIRVHAALFDVNHSQHALAERDVRLPLNPTTAQVSAGFEELADSLVATSAGQPTPTTAPAVFGTRSLDALLAFAAADSALYVWNLARADSAFRAARDADPRYGYAWLRVAQVAQWRGRDPSTYADDAARALALASQLSAADSGHAAALAALGAGRYEEACEYFRRLTRRNAEDVFAWYGLGDCLRRDEAVVRAPSSPTGWRFRSSYREAISALSRALTSAPSVARVWQGPAFEQLSRTFFVSPFEIRGGRPVPPDTGLFGAFPDLDHDTLAFVARPLIAVRSDDKGAEAPNRAEAVRRNRDTLLAVTAQWVAAFGNRSEAWAARARALETAGMPAGPGAGSALDAVRRARSLHPPADLAWDLAASEGRLLLKTSDYVAAAAVADSALSSLGSSGSSAQRAALLALRGRIAEAATALETAVGDTVLLDNSTLVLRGDLRRRVGRLEAFASFELPPDSVREAMRRVQQSAGSYFVGPARAVAVWALLSHPLAMAFGELSTIPQARGPAGPDYVLRWRLMLERGDTAGIRREMRAKDAVRERLLLLPGEVDVEWTFNEARIALAIGDTADAIRRLDRTLTALPTIDPYVLDRVPPAAGLVRAMALRAELAARASDGETARHWATAVLALWRGADPALGPTLLRMEELTHTSH
jgi:tetratricopeptide (TPR) repeat protein